jgi:hypothetical protein
MTTIVKTVKPEPDIYVNFEPGRVIIVRDEVVWFTFEDWQSIDRKVRKHLKALALAEKRKPHTERMKKLAGGYAAWASEHLGPAPSEK